MRRWAWLFLGLGTTFALTVGCSVFRKPSVVPESVARCRQYARQGSSAVDRGEWNQAEEYLRQAVQASPVDHEARRQLAEVLWQKGVTGESIQQMEFALRLAPGDASLAVRTGEMVLAAGRVEQALAYADWAIAIEPDLAAAWALRGRIHAKTGNLTQSLADLHRALAYSPSDEDVLLDIAAIHHRRREPERCLTTIHHLLDLHPPGEEPQEALYLEGIALSQLGRFDDAAESLQTALRRGPPRADILYQLAEVEFALGRIQAAQLTARSVLATDSNHAATLALISKMNQTGSSSKEFDQNTGQGLQAAKIIR
ncbi:MAG: tetratricopeptide repeat protein [Pirellulales bacterium]|nr:tetratricopeptide repeat protein [Pirellulales bacterium]